MKTKQSSEIIEIIKNTINSMGFMRSNRVSKKDFTRNRKLPFVPLICFMLSSIKHTLQKELTQFINQISKFSNISKSAFCQQRVKLKPKAFLELNDVLVREFYSDNIINKWNGFRLLAIDGSSLELPSSPETLSEFGYNNSENMTSMAKISTFFDLLNNICIEGEIAPNKTDEYSMALKHLEKSSKKDLILFDRGFGARWLFYYLFCKNIDYVIRLQQNFGEDIDNFWESNETSRIMELDKLPKKSRKRLRNLGIDFKHFKFRLVKVMLDNGQIEVLATSLIDEYKYPAYIFKKLYFKRWGIEVNFDHLKNHIEIGNFSGYSPQIIKQDFYANLLISNIQSLIIRDAQKELDGKKENTKYEYKINRNLSLAYMKDKMVDILIGNNPNYMDELKKLFQIEPVPIRDDRKFPRKDKRYRRKYFMNQRRAL